jgi:prepilin-type N-terminal cleavage/methylation domain-containing protein
MSSRRTAGFSLVELMVVLVIGGLILGMGLPALNRYMTGGNVRNAANILEGEMRLARQKAVSRDMRAYVWYASGVNYYYTGDQLRTGATTWGGITWKGPNYLPKRLNVSNPNFGGYNYFYYAPDGKPMSPVNTQTSGTCAIVSTVSGQPDTARVYVDLSGSVWQ